MLPSGYILLDAFPYTATSKVDRKALSDLDLGQVRFRPGYVPPEDEIEEKVAAIFAEVLDIQGVGRLDDFFLSGGDSLSLVNLQILATETFGQQLAELHEDASVKGVAEWLRAHRTSGEIQAPIVLSVRTEGTNPPLFVVHGRRGQAHVGPHFLELLGRDQPLYALQARGLDGRQEPHRSVEAMAAEYVAAIQKVQPKGPYFIGGFCAGSYVAIEVARLLYRQGEKFYAPLLIDPPRPNFAITAEDVSEELLLRQLERRVKSGTWNVDLHNDTAVKAAIDVARAFDEALRNYRPQPFPIRSLIIATVRRWRNRFSVKRVFGPSAQVLLIDGGHGEILSADNVQFARAVKHCVTYVATAARHRQARLAGEAAGQRADAKASQTHGKGAGGRLGAHP